MVWRGRGPGTPSPCCRRPSPASDTRTRCGMVWYGMVWYGEGGARGHPRHAAGGRHQRQIRGPGASTLEPEQGASCSSDMLVDVDP